MTVVIGWSSPLTLGGRRQCNTRKLQQANVAMLASVKAASHPPLGRWSCLPALLFYFYIFCLVSIVANKQTCLRTPKLIFIDNYKSLSQTAEADEDSTSSGVVWPDDWSMQAAHINRGLWIWTRNDWLVQHDLKLNRKISNTVDCARRLCMLRLRLQTCLPTAVLN